MCVCFSAQYGSLYGSFSLFFGSSSLEGWRVWQVLPMLTDFPINPSFALSHSQAHKHAHCCPHPAGNEKEAFWCISAAETVTGLLRTLQRSEAVISHTACPVPFTPSDTPSYSTLH